MRRLFFSLVFLFLAFPANAFAQDYSIKDFRSDISIQPDGLVRVEETITTQFYTEKHGIYRDIPYIYENTDGTKTYTEIIVKSVHRNNTPEPFEKIENDSYLRIKIGDAQQTITGTQVYTIIYDAKGVLRGFDRYDELYWNVTGNNWDTMIDSTLAVVHLPQNGIIQLSCYEGFQGSTAPCQSIKASDQEARFQSPNILSSGEGVTIAVGYTKGIVPLLTVPPPEEFSPFKPQYILSLLGTFLVGLSGLLFLWYRYGRDYWYQTPQILDSNTPSTTKPLGSKESIVVEFTPPENLRPAEIGVLMDEKADTLDVTATLIDLACRGFLTITEIPKKWMFGSVDYELKKTKKDIKDLLPYESLLLGNLFKSADTVKVSSLKLTFYDELKKVKESLYDTIVSKQFFIGHPEKARLKYLIAGIILSGISFYLIIHTATTRHFLLTSFFVGVLASSLSLILVSRTMARRSATGRELYRRIKGYQVFIEKVETYKQQFFEKKNMFNEILPYTIVFGLTEKFAQALKDMGVEPKPPTWYHGTTPFRVTAFGSNINKFSTAMSTAIAATPSSSGSGGSGSSGGGFGGGGGGSW